MRILLLKSISVVIISFFCSIALAQSGKQVQLFEVQENMSLKIDAESHELNTNRVSFNESVLDQNYLRVGDVVYFELNGELEEFEITRKSSYTGEAFSIIANRVKNTSKSLNMSIHENKVNGEISFDDKNHFHLRSSKVNDVQTITEVDQSKLPIEECDAPGIDINYDTTGEINQKQQTEHEQDTVTIDLMIPYTQKAEDFAISDMGSVESFIELVMSESQAVLDNSEVFIELDLVHFYKTDYNEDDNSEVSSNQHLCRLTVTDAYNPNSFLCNEDYDDYFTEVHSLRRQHEADIVALLLSEPNTGGSAWLLNWDQGNANAAFSINRVEQVTFANTMIHEIGHNMGNAHSRNQSSNPAGTNGGLYEYSTGWKWVGTDSIVYVSVMTYAEGNIRAPVFSNPNINWNGGQTGSYDEENEYAPADNARSMREIKSVIAEYGEIISEGIELSVSRDTISFGNVEVGNSEISSFDVTGKNLRSDIVLSSKSGFEISDDSLSGYSHGLRITQGEEDLDTTIFVQFSPTDEITYDDLVTVNSSEADFQQVVVIGTGITSEVADVEIYFETEFNGLTGDTLILPVFIGSLNGSSIESFEFDLEYNSDQIELLSVTEGEVLNDDFEVEENDLEGTLEVSAASSQAITESGILVNLEVYLQNSGSSDLAWSSFSFNNGDPIAVTTDGSITIEIDISSPNLITPENGAEDVDLNPPFTWSSAGDFNDYELQISENNDFNSASTFEVMGDTTYGLQELDSNTSYFWRVRAVSESGNTNWSGSFIFTTEDTELPGVENPIGLVELDEDFGTFVAADLDTVFSGSDTESFIYDIADSTEIIEAFLNESELVLNSIENIFGESEVVISAFGENDIELRDTLEVVINPVNDAPYFIDLPDTITFQSGEEYTFEFSDNVDDVDDELSELDFSANVEPEDIEVEISLTDYIILFTSPDFSGEGTMNFTVNDPAGEEAEEELVIIVEPSTSAGGNGPIPTEYRLSQNYPNPFNPVTKIEYQLPQVSKVYFQIFDMTGRVIYDQSYEQKPAGTYNISFDASSLSSGVYIYRLKAGDYVETKKMTLIK